MTYTIKREHRIENFPTAGAPIDLPKDCASIDAILYRDRDGTTHSVTGFVFDAHEHTVKADWPADVHADPYIRVAYSDAGTA